MTAPEPNPTAYRHLTCRWYRLGISGSRGPANAMIKLLRDEELWTKLIKNGLDTARKFTWDRITDAFENATRS